MRAGIYLIVLLSLLNVSSFGESNCYILIEQNLNYSENKTLIQSYGGRIIHAFPPNEFICEMSDMQYHK